MGMSYINISSILPYPLFYKHIATCSCNVCVGGGSSEILPFVFLRNTGLTCIFSGLRDYLQVGRQVGVHQKHILETLDSSTFTEGQKVLVVQFMKILRSHKPSALTAVGLKCAGRGQQGT